jgi:hypothetical protein
MERGQEMEKAANRRGVMAREGWQERGKGLRGLKAKGLNAKNEIAIGICSSNVGGWGS